MYARSAPAAGALALVCIGLTTGLGTADATQVRPQLYGTMHRYGAPSLNGSPPRMVAVVWTFTVHPALNGNPRHPHLSYPLLIAGDSHVQPVPPPALPSRSTHTSPAGKTAPVSGGHGDAHLPASQAHTVLATLTGIPVGRSLGLQSAHNDSPPHARGASRDPLATLATATLHGASYVGPNGYAVGLSTTLSTLHSHTARQSSLSLERVLDSQTFASAAPLSFARGQSDPAGDLAFTAQRPPIAAGLKMVGVRPGATRYLQPIPPTATVVVPTATPYVPPATATTYVPPATATTIRVIPATATFKPTLVPATSVPAATPTIYTRAAYIQPATPTPAPTSPTTWTAASMPGGNARMFRITGYTWTGSRTATGTWPHWGTVAVDTRVIPLGSTVYIQGLGVFRAEDTGGAVIGPHIDVFVNSDTQAYQLTGYRYVSFVPPAG